MNIYYISGLGADQRAFSKLDFVKTHNAIYIPWIPIIQKRETIESYATRIADLIKGEDPIIIGLSFGGMVAMEIAKLIPIKKIILISSCKTKNELPPQIKMAGALGLDSMLPIALIKSSKSIVYNFLGTNSPQEKIMVEDYIEKMDDEYLTWSMRSISRWKNSEIACPVTHIHGNNDMLLQSNYVEANYIIEGGNHFMIYNKAEEINPIINQELANI